MNELTNPNQPESINKELIGEDSEETIGEPLHNKNYLVCSRCDNFRHELLYFEQDQIVIRCLSCGLVTKLPFGAKLEREKNKRNHNKKKPTYV